MLKDKKLRAEIILLHYNILVVILNKIKIREVIKYLVY